MVSKEGIVMWQDAEGVALDGWMKVVSTSLIGLEITQTRFFRLVKHPTQLFYYTSEKTSKPRGKVELKSSDGEPLPITIENNVLVMKSSTMRILCDSADEATMWGLAIKACLLHEKTKEIKQEAEKQQSQSDEDCENRSLLLSSDTIRQGFNRRCIGDVDKGLMHRVADDSNTDNKDVAKASVESGDSPRSTFKSEQKSIVTMMKKLLANPLSSSSQSSTASSTLRKNDINSKNQRKQQRAERNVILFVD
mmetsp:Transcript_34765/g.55912  ORF Transcript_34765/g.55912 Transcript_34765/m.55912 type:complete len:250 (-) Transcript_34765:44-793(-)